MPNLRKKDSHFFVALTNLFLDIFSVLMMRRFSSGKQNLHHGLLLTTGDSRYLRLSVNLFVNSDHFTVECLVPGL